VCANKARQQYTPFFFLYSNQNKTLYNEGIHESNKFCITSFYANELYTNRICSKYTQIGFIFSFTPTTIKLHNESLHEK